MTAILRLLALGAVALAMVAAPQAASAQRADAKVRVKLVKPLVLTGVQDLDFGTIVPAAGSGTQTVTIQPNGTLDCPAPTVCIGTAVPATFNIRGSNRRNVLITATASDLENALTGDTIAFAPIAPTALTLPNSGNQGIDFFIGGAIAIPEDAAGDYEGIIEITADYE